MADQDVPTRNVGGGSSNATAAAAEDATASSSSTITTTTIDDVASDKHIDLEVGDTNDGPPVEDASAPPGENDVVL
jgi:hypothetical protein